MQDFLQRVRQLTLIETGNANACANPPTTTLVSMGADMRGDEGAADMPPDDEFTLEPL